MKKTVRYFVFGLAAVGLFAGMSGPVDGQDNKAAGNEDSPAIAIEETSYDLGPIPRDQGKIIGFVPFSNKGKSLLEITKVTGSCSCFDGYFGDTRAEPGESGVLEVVYDKNKIPGGKQRREAKIQTNDPAIPVKTVYFSFQIDRTAEEEEKWQLRNDITTLKNDLRLVRSDLRKVLTELAAIKRSTAAAAKKPAPRKADTTVYKIDTKTSPYLGPENAPVTIVEFSDFQCPYCIREYPKIQQVLKEFPNQVKFVFKHYPLAFHKKAPAVHAATELAFREKGNDAFWKMHDMILKEPKKLDPKQMLSYAEQLDLDTVQLGQALEDQEKVEALLAPDKAAAGKCKVRGTPSVYVNGLKITNRTVEGYRARIKQILNAGKNKANKRPGK
jgi:protein-disulfide isomerase